MRSTMRTRAVRLAAAVATGVSLFLVGAFVQSRLPVLPAGGDGSGGSASPVARRDAQETATYSNRLVPAAAPSPIFSRHPDFVASLDGTPRFVGLPLVVDAKPTLAVRAWRYSYNARGVVEIPNELDGRKTAVIIAHPWGIDDGQGWKTPAPAGVAFFATPAKNAIYQRHLREVVNPFLERLRPHVGLVGYSLPGSEDPVRKELYRSPRTGTRRPDRQAGMGRLQETLRSFDYQGEPLAGSLPITKGTEAFSYFKAFKGLDASDRYNNAGFWRLPIPLAAALRIGEQDIVFYDEHGYDEVRTYLKRRGITNILLGGYATDLCLRSSTAGYENLRRDFNVFIVGDATLATFPAQRGPQVATTVTLTQASLQNLITEIGWIRVLGGSGR